MDFKKYLNLSNPQSMYLNPTSVFEIKLVLRELKSKNSSGLDEIPMSILKSTPDNILFAGNYIFNLSLTQGKYINHFKNAKIIPVHKKGSKYDVNNYRPISLLPAMSKILEKIMYKRLYSFLSRSNFFHSQQFGFRNNHSTNHALLSMISDITKAFEERKYTVGVFLDLTKAFDTINHRVLLHKLEYFGIRGIAHDWFSSYLKNRSMQTAIKNKLSTSKLINLGVPQGSILGPLLVLIYINDLPNCISQGKIIMLADDTNLFFSSKSYVDLNKTVNSELEKLYCWLSANKLTLNTNKTKYITFSTPNSPPTPSNFKIILKDSEIERVKSIKFLGIIYTSKTSFLEIAHEAFDKKN